jgi:putative phage-type endonuclease
VGASDANVIMGASPWFSRDQLLLRKVEELRARHPTAGAPRGAATSRQPDNGAMARGRRLEPVARDLYTALTGRRMTPLCVLHDRHDWCRASLDGIDDGRTLALEIKCPNHRDHGEAVSGRVPAKYKAQVQHQLLVTDTRVLHYFSYTDNPKFAPADRAVLVPVVADDVYQEELLAREETFWHEVERLTEQPAWLTTSEWRPD